MRDDSIRQNSAIVINVFEKQIQSGDALGEATFDLAPFVVGNDAREKIIREHTLGAFRVAVDGEGDALMEKRQFGSLLAFS